jgi:hypothetical protein
VTDSIEARKEVKEAYFSRTEPDKLFIERHLIPMKLFQRISNYQTNNFNTALDSNIYKSNIMFFYSSFIVIIILWILFCQW